MKFRAASGLSVREYGRRKRSCISHVVPLTTTTTTTSSYRSHGTLGICHPNDVNTTVPFQCSNTRAKKKTLRWKRVTPFTTTSTLRTSWDTNAQLFHTCSQSSQSSQSYNYHPFSIRYNNIGLSSLSSSSCCHSLYQCNQSTLFFSRHYHSASIYQPYNHYQKLDNSWNKLYTNEITKHTKQSNHESTRRQKSTSTISSSTTTTTSSSSKSSKTSSTICIPTASLPLGHPLPLDEHACSVSLPTWSSVVGYEEGSPQITNNLACGYPRFVYHPYVLQLMDVALSLDVELQDIQLQQQQQQQKDSFNSTSTTNSNEGQIRNQWDCLVLPNRQSALRCHDFLVKACGYYDGQAVSPKLATAGYNTLAGNTRIQLFVKDNALDLPTSTTRTSSTDNDNVESVDYNPNVPIRVLNLDGGSNTTNTTNTSSGTPTNVHAVIFPARTEFAIEAKSYWQHTGEVVSSRLAEKTLTNLGIWSVDNHHQDDGTTGSASDADINPRFTTPFLTKDEVKSCQSLGCTDATKYWSYCPQTNLPHIALYPSSSSSSSDESSMDNNMDYHQHIKDRISSIVGLDPSSVFLAHSGMASIYAALRSARRRKLMNDSDGGGGTSIVYGFPYLDTLKMCSRSEFVPDGVEFFGHGDENDLNKLERMLETRASSNSGDGVSVLITEYPSNPLLNCPDLHQLRSLADKYDFALVVDDTIGNFANVDLIQTGLADVVCTSLTKLFNGRGDAMAGSIVANTNTKVGQWIQKDMMDQQHKFGEVLWEGDARAIYENSFDFLERSSKINHTAEALADWLKEREEVCSVYYPKFTSKEGYDLLMKREQCSSSGDGGVEHDAGYGGLMSIVLHPHICQRTFYDKLDVSKGPSLGTNFTLVCPYTLLAHYHELDFAMSYQVKPNLLRISVGLEELDELIKKFDNAFSESKLHPKLPVM